MRNSKELLSRDDNLVKFVLATGAKLNGAVSKCGY